MSWQKDYITALDRISPIDVRGTWGLSRWLFKMALKPDLFAVLKKDYRYMRNRMTAALQHPSPLTRRVAVTLCGVTA